MKISYTSVLLFLGLSSGAFNACASDRFEFMVVGDTAYTEKSVPTYQALVDKINKADPDFVLHVGDTLGYQDCSDKTYDAIDTFFSRFEPPLIYTPGDNEWTDCQHEGYYDAHQRSDWKEISDYKLGRLAELRKRYFSTEESLGQNKLKLKRQSDHGKAMYEKFAENTYWIHNNILFATVHIVGTSDSFHPYMPGLTNESVERRGANYSWIIKLIDIAEIEGVSAIVIAGHAELFGRVDRLSYDVKYSGTHIRGGNHGPYIGYVHALSVLSSQFEKPILYVHGDHHRFVVDRPMLMNRHTNDIDKYEYDNVWRLQTFGDPDAKAVRVTVDPESPSVFSFSPFY